MLGQPQTVENVRLSRPWFNHFQSMQMWIGWYSNMPTLNFMKRVNHLSRHLTLLIIIIQQSKQSEQSCILMSWDIYIYIYICLHFKLCRRACTPFLLRYLRTLWSAMAIFNSILLRVLLECDINNNRKESAREVNKANTAEEWEEKTKKKAGFKE